MMTMQRLVAIKSLVPLLRFFLVQLASCCLPKCRTLTFFSNNAPRLPLFGYGAVADNAA